MSAWQAKLAAADAYLAASDPVMAQLVRERGPCTLGGARRDPFDVLINSIISQQLSTRAAETIRGRVASALGAGSRFRPEHFAGAAAGELRACGLSNAKAKWVAALAAATTSGELSFPRLRRLDDAAAIEHLDALPGIGRWTAEMFLIFALARLDIFALGDAGLRRGVNRLYGKGRALSERRTLRIAAAWAPYRSVASWYLWRSLEGPAAL